MQPQVHRFLLVSLGSSQACTLGSLCLWGLAQMPGVAAGLQRRRMQQDGSASPAPSPPAQVPIAAAPVNPNTYAIGAAVGVAFGALVVGLAVALFMWYRCHQRRKKRRAGLPNQEVPTSTSAEGLPAVSIAVQPGSGQLGSLHGASSANTPLVRPDMHPLSHNPPAVPTPPHSGQGPRQAQGPPSGGGQRALNRTSGKGGSGIERGESTPLPSQASQASQPGTRPRITRQELQQMTGLEPGHPFMKGTARAYHWCMGMRDKPIAIEEGVNAASQAALVASDGKWHVSGTHPGPEPIQLSSADVDDQIELLGTGFIGSGASAVVFKCRWPKRFGKNALLAAKLLPEVTDSKDKGNQMLTSFKYEADILTRCRHPNVVRLYGYCLEPPTVCLIMELLPGSLESRLYGQRMPSLRIPAASAAVAAPPRGSSVSVPRKSATAGAPSSSHSAPGLTTDGHAGSTTRPPPCTILEVLKFSTDIAAGLAHLHAFKKNTVTPASEGDDEDDMLTQRIMHRDLKPANILLNSKGVAKITDFGIAKEFLTTGGVDTNHANLGTIRYMGPELIDGSQATKITCKVDLYSLGIMMWEMVMREVPFKDCDDFQIPVQVATKKNRPPTPGFQVSPDSLDLSLYTPASFSMLPRISGNTVANFTVLPHFTTIIHACWHTNARSRPSAQLVYEQLKLLIDRINA